MKAIDRRLRRLEEQARPQVNERDQRIAEVLRERRRRRLEAAGLPFKERSWVGLTGAQSFGEALQLCLWQARESRRSGG